MIYWAQVTASEYPCVSEESSAWELPRWPLLHCPFGRWRDVCLPAWCWCAQWQQLGFHSVLSLQLYSQPFYQQKRDERWVPGLERWASHGRPFCCYKPGCLRPKKLKVGKFWASTIKKKKLAEIVCKGCECVSSRVGTWNYIFSTCVRLSTANSQVVFCVSSFALELGSLPLLVGTCFPLFLFYLFSQLFRVSLEAS